MTTGDLKGSLRKIEQGLRLLNYPRDVDYTALVRGDPAAFLPIISYSFTSFSTYIAELLVNCDVELTAKSDLRFIEAIYKLLRDQFHYKPVLTKEQFLQFGFAERKMQIVCDVINCVVTKHKELSNLNKVKSQTRKKLKPLKYEIQSNCGNVLAGSNVSAPSSKQVLILDRARYFFQNAVDGNKDYYRDCHSSFAEKSISALMKPQVEQHSGSEVRDDLRLAPINPAPLQPASLTAEGGNEEESSLDDGVVEVKCEQVIGDNSQIEFLRSQLADCQEKLHRLDWVEDKLRVLEERLKGKVIIDEKDWNNLLSRVLLLETELLVQSKKRDSSAEFSGVSQECSPSVIPVSLDTEKEEMPECLHQSSGYSSLLSTDPSPKAMTINSPDLTDISKETTRQRMERISKIIEETSELLKTSSNTSEKT